jgi:hypothetical protein
MKKSFFFFLFIPIFCTAQDSLYYDGKKIITLSTVIVDGKFNVPSFIKRVTEDTSFYKAFRNLHLVNFSAINDIRMLNKSNEQIASLNSTTKQTVLNNCRSMQTISQAVSGDMFNTDSSFNYYTANMYASLFFTKGSICGETNIVKDANFNTSNKSGMEKHKEQLKILFFNPGKRISGLPFMSNKTAIYDDELAAYYDMDIDWQTYNGVSCYVFNQKVKPGNEDDVVVNEMTTWFNDSTYEVVGRKYDLSYGAGVYDFKVSMEILMTRVGELTVPSLIKYNGNWKAIFKKRERGVFTATLSNFSIPTK